MKNASSVTQGERSVTQQRDTLARARPSFGGDVTVSRVTTQRDVTVGARDSDKPARRPARHHHEAAPSRVTKPMTWMHIAALNLIADHDAGVKVDPVKLDAARRLVEAA